MDREIKPVWSTVGEIDPRELVEARLQLHWAAQPVMAFADCALEHVSDDSQANLGWRDDLEAPARIPHHVATTARDMPQSAAFSPIGVLDVQSSTTPRPARPGRSKELVRSAGWPIDGANAASASWRPLRRLPFSVWRLSWPPVFSMSR